MLGSVRDERREQILVGGVGTQVRERQRRAGRTRAAQYRRERLAVRAAVAGLGGYALRVTVEAQVRVIVRHGAELCKNQRQRQQQADRPGVLPTR